MKSIMRNKKKTAGFTVLEFMIAASISAFVMLFVAFAIIYSARSQAILFPQTTNQLYATRAMQAMSDLLRNASYASIEVAQDGQSIDFESSELSTGQTARIFLDNNGEILYDSDVDNATNELRVIARQVQNLTIALVDVDQLVELDIEFFYRKYRGYGTEDDELLNGHFATRVFPRNS